MSTPALNVSPTSGIDTRRYDLGTPRLFANDPVSELGIRDIAILSESPHWEDRIRAELIRDRRDSIALPDGFPAIYETQESPSLNRPRVLHYRPARHSWVVSPDIEMLTELLPLYQTVWDNYTSQWTPDARRTFAVGRLDGLSTHGVYMPGATPADVIAQTFLTHGDIYRRQPIELQRLHPLYKQWHPEEVKG